jgi:hypothetical protein
MTFKYQPINKKTV